MHQCVKHEKFVVSRIENAYDRRPFEVRPIRENPIVMLLGSAVQEPDSTFLSDCALARCARVSSTVPDSLAPAEYHWLLASASEMEQLTISCNPDDVLQAVTAFSELFRGPKLDPRYRDSAILLQLLGAVGRFPTVALVQSLGVCFYYYFSHPETEPPPAILEFILVQFTNPPPSPTFLVPFCRALGSVIKYSDVVEDESFFRRLAELVGTDQELNASICELLMELLRVHSPPAASCLGLLAVVDVLADFIVADVGPELVLDFTNVIFRLLSAILWLGVFGIVEPYWEKLCRCLCSFWGVSSDVDSNLALICHSGLPVSCLPPLLEAGGLEAMEKLILETGEESAFELLGLLVQCGCDFDRFLPVVMDVVLNGGFSARVAAGVCLLSFIQTRTELVAESFLVESQEDSDEDPSPTNYARALLSILELDSEIAKDTAIQALEYLHRYFLNRDQVHEFYEVLDFYHFRESLERIDLVQYPSLAMEVNFVHLMLIGEWSY
jgi:hypothetical protein